LGNGVKPPFNQRRPQFIAEFWTYTKMRKPWVYVQVVSVTLNNFCISIGKLFKKHFSGYQSFQKHDCPIKWQKSPFIACLYFCDQLQTVLSTNNKALHRRGEAADSRDPEGPASVIAANKNTGLCVRRS
jgi:hypothetical protein